LINSVKICRRRDDFWVLLPSPNLMTSCRIHNNFFTYPSFKACLQ
jgi:hypothetical protein